MTFSRPKIGRWIWYLYSYFCISIILIVWCSGTYSSQGGHLSVSNQGVGMYIRMMQPEFSECSLDGGISSTGSRANPTGWPSTCEAAVLHKADCRYEIQMFWPCFICFGRKRMRHRCINPCSRKCVFAHIRRREAEYVELQIYAIMLIVGLQTVDLSLTSLLPKHLS